MRTSRKARFTCPGPLHAQLVLQLKRINIKRNHSQVYCPRTVYLDLDGLLGFARKVIITTVKVLLGAYGRRGISRRNRRVVRNP